MKAVRTHGRGGPEQLFFEDAPMPELKMGEVMVRVHATGITPAELTWAETYRNPDGSERIPGIPGHEISGVVETVGQVGNGFQAGDAVFGLIDFPRDGAAAEYAAVEASALASKPGSVDHCGAAAVPLSGLTAWQALFQYGELSAGQRVLIHGAAGGVGVFAVQLAHWRGAHVIATGSPHNTEFLRSLGADEVIDYTSVQFDETLSDLDLVVDTIGGETRDRSWNVLRPGGTLVTLPGPFPSEKPAQSSVRGVFFIVKPNREMLTGLADLIDQQVLKPVVSNVLPLERTREAFERGASGHTRGKIILKVQGCL